MVLLFETKATKSHNPLSRMNIQTIFLSAVKDAA